MLIQVLMISLWTSGVFPSAETENTLRQNVFLGLVAASVRGALAWSVLETSEVGAYAYRAGVSGGPSIGGYVAGLGAVLVAAAGFLAPRDRRADRRDQENLALRWARRGRLLPAAEVLQRLVTTATPAEDAAGDTLRWRLHLAEILAVLGRFPHAEGQRVLAADSEQWHAIRVGAASITGVYDP